MAAIPEVDADAPGRIAMLGPLILVVAAIGSVGALWRRGVLRKNALDVSPRDVGALSWFAWAMLAAATYYAMIIGVFIAGGLAGAGEGAAGLRWQTLGSLGGYVGGLSVVGVFIALRRKETAAAGLRLTFRDAIKGLGALLVVFPIIWTVGASGRLVSLLLAMWSGAEAPGPLGHETLRALSDNTGDLWWWGTVVMVTIGAPIFEETLYRGLLQTSLASLMESKWKAVLITSAIFMAAHIGEADVYTLPSLFAFSICLGVAFERTGRLGVAIVMHALFNMLNIALAMLPQ